MGRCTKREGSWLFFVAKASKTGLEKAADPKRKVQLNDKVDLIFVLALLDLIFELQCSNSI